MTGDRVEAASDTGIYVSGGSATDYYTTISGSVVLGGGSNGGIVCYNARSVSIEGNTVKGTTGAPIDTQSSSDYNLVDGNVVQGSISTTGANTVVGENITR